MAVPGRAATRSIVMQNIYYGMYPKSEAGSGGFVTPKKTLVTIKIEMPVMTSAKAYERALEIAKQIKEDEGVRVRGINVVG